MTIESVASPSAIAVRHLGRTRYLDALALQRETQQRRKDGLTGDTILLTEHEPVLTLGRRGDTGNLRAPAERLAELGIDLVPVERGGDITYHGPGQIVAYPIIDLRGYGGSIHRYVRALEESCIRFLANYGVAGERRPGTPGVWAADDKIASVGVFVSRWVTMHGVAINIDPDLSHFDLIHPCGLVGTRMTSLAEQLGHAVSLHDAAGRFAETLVSVLDELRQRPQDAGL